MPGRKKSAKAAEKQKQAEEDEKNKIPGPPFFCTFRDCKANFDTLPLLIHHKIKTPEHEYCAQCNLDFEDDAAFLLHKIKEIQHIVCPICSEDFRSQDGCDRHVRQAHAAEQNLICVGCGEKFVRAGGLMSHIELNRCPGIPKQEFEKRRAQKELVKAFLSNPTERTRYGFTSEAADSVDGGVPVNLGSLLDYDDNSSVISGVPLEPRRMSPAISGIASPPPSVTEQWPALDTKTYNSEPQDEDNLLLDAEAFSRRTPTPTPTIKTPIPGSAKSPASNWGSTSASTVLWPNAPKTPVTPEWAAQMPPSKEDELTAENLRKLLDTDHPFHPNSKDFNVMRFFNPITKNCPSCLKIFGSTTALIQHCESATNRCKISESDHYGQAMDTFSGGIIETKGHHTDGTVRYTATTNFW